MKALHKAELELGTKIERRQGMDFKTPAAFVSIETEDSDLPDRIITALTHVEALEV